jgi:K+-sensing histidine kinase KdpD
MIDRLSSQVRELSDSLERQSSFGERYLEGVSERIQQISAKSVAEISHMVDEFRRNVSVAQVKQPVADSDAKSSESRQGLIRELSHALFTPLSRVDVIASNVISSNPGAAISEKMVKTKSAIEICYAYLTAYRNVITVSERSSYWSPQSLQKSINSSAEVFLESLDKKVNVGVAAPDQVGSVSNIYLLAVLLPLIENAADATENGDTIRIEVGEEGNSLVARVSNPLHEAFAGDDIFSNGFTTKTKAKRAGQQKSHEGLGLTIVQNLLSAVSGAGITYDIADEIVTFKVTLPSRS